MGVLVTNQTATPGMTAAFAAGSPVGEAEATVAARVGWGVRTALDIWRRDRLWDQ